ncbi:MAG: hypothetical protein U1A24_16270 [Cypionkella sp.]|nr:hypothetical protein [Cypionkella sp.]
MMARIGDTWLLGSSCGGSGAEQQKIVPQRRLPLNLRRVIA